jgi:hypothetical protein
METTPGTKGKWMGMVDSLLGAAMIAAGVGMAAGILLHPEESPAGMTTGLWGPLHVVFFLGLFVVLLGCLRLYGMVIERAGGMGLAAVILFSLGLVGFAGAMMLESAVMPVLAGSEATRNLVEESSPLFSGALGIWFIVIAVSFTIGAILFGLVLRRAPGMPRWPGWLFFSAPLFAFEPPLPLWLARIGLVLFCVGIFGLGLGLMRTGGVEAGEI